MLLVQWSGGSALSALCGVSSGTAADMETRATFVAVTAGSSLEKNKTTGAEKKLGQIHERCFPLYTV